MGHTDDDAHRMLLARRCDLRMLDSFGLQDGRTVRLAPNLLAGTSVYTLSR